VNHRQNHFDTLNVSRNAPPEVVRAAYKALSQHYHPDRNAKPEAPGIMCSLNLAYSVLGDPQKRQEYESELALTSDNLPSARGSRRRRLTQEDYRARGTTRARQRRKVITRFSLLVFLVFTSSIAAEVVQSERAYASSMGAHEQSLLTNAAHKTQTVLQR
jgi:curved DNA-binding protein CbpA